MIPTGVDKGIAVSQILSDLHKGTHMGGGASGLPLTAADFVLVIGDNASDEAAFNAAKDFFPAAAVGKQTTVLTCTIGTRASDADFYVDDNSEVQELLAKLTSNATSRYR